MFIKKIPMKTVFKLVLFFLVIYACADKGKSKMKVNTQKEENSIFDFDTLKGIYYGDFGNSTIDIVLKYVSEKHAVGYNIHKGLQRNITGKVIDKGETIEMFLNEPGDNEFDGVFHLYIRKKDFSMTGEWNSNSGKIESKKFNLEKRVFKELDYENLKLENINNSNFSQYFYRISDSIGTLYFHEDGSCNYVQVLKYKNSDSEMDSIAMSPDDRKEEILEIYGNWTLKKDKLIIEWKENSIFDKRSIYSIQIGDLEKDDFYFRILYKDRVFDGFMW